jgi:putative membrane protein
MSAPLIARNDSFYKRLIYIVSVAVFLAVVVLNRLPKQAGIPDWVKVLPTLNALLNGTTSVLLILSLYFIRKKNIDMHRRINLLACVLSTVFLLSYVAFHAFYGDTTFPKDHPWKYFYYFILASHIILAAIVLPLVLLSLYRGLTNQVVSHKKITRWSYPIWLYVTVTGVIVYLMISPYYTF